MKAQRLESGNSIGVIAPSRSLSVVHPRWIEIAERFFQERGLRVHFSTHCKENWHNYGGTIEQRVSDLMEMFNDEKIQGIISAIGGYGSNHLLPHLDYNAIKQNPKIFLGYSDITALLNAIHAKTGIVTFYGPHFSTLGQPFPFEYTIRCFDAMLIKGEAAPLVPGDEFAEDDWYLDPMHPAPRAMQKNTGWSVIREGNAEGELIGGNISTFQKLLGTEYVSSLKDKVLFFEEWQEVCAHQIDSILTQFSQAGVFDQARGLIVGRFPTKCGFSNYEKPEEMLYRITKDFHFPVVYGLDFGHTDPLMTIPIGIPCSIDGTRRRIQYLETGVL